MPDIADQIRAESLKKIDSRLDELEEAQKEIAELQALRRSLIGGPARSTSGRSGRATREEVEKREQQVVAILKESPDTGPSALATMLSMSPSAMSQFLRRMADKGLLKHDDTGWSVA